VPYQEPSNTEWSTPDLPRCRSGFGRILTSFARTRYVNGPLSVTDGAQEDAFLYTNINQKDLVFLKELLEAGKVVPVIDRRYRLSETAEALRYLEERHARGKIVLTVEHSKGS
jgi:NADPH:quinone reductase-like Zn-dependent oxidoreductase